MYILYDVMEILRQVVQLLILMGCGVGVVYLILVLRDLQKFLNRAADLGIDAMMKLNDEIDHLDETIGNGFEGLFEGNSLTYPEVDEGEYNTDHGTDGQSYRSVCIGECFDYVLVSTGFCIEETTQGLKKLDGTWLYQEPLAE